MTAKVVGNLGPYPWFAVEATHLDHPKAEQLVERLGGDCRVALHIAAVWGFFSQKFPEGTMPDEPWAVAAMERWARWSGKRKRGQLADAMIAVGLLARDETTGTIAVHDWAVYQAAHAERRAKDREYQKRRREELKAAARHDVGTTVGTTSAGPSPSSSPSPSPSASAACEEDAQQHGTVCADGLHGNSGGVFWRDSSWIESIAERLSPERKGDFLAALRDEAEFMRWVPEGTAEWVSSDRRAREHLEARFAQFDASLGHERV